MRSEITLRLQQAAQSWFLWGEDEAGTPVPRFTWLRHTFSWHTSSFYGTFLKEITYEGREGISLHPIQAFEYIALRPSNSFAALRHGIEAWIPQAEALAAWEDYREGRILPSMSNWKEQMSWKPEQADITTSLLTQLFSDAVNEALRTSTYSNGNWEKARQIYQNQELTIKQLQTALDEEDWLRKIGYLEDGIPFTISLRLLEPHEDGDMWKLETVLTPKRGAQRTYIFTGSTSLPKRWRDYEDRIQSTYEGWGKLVPWLLQEGAWRTELTEAEAWRFLTEASQELLQAGVEILLPAWWQALAQNSFSLRAKVKGDKSNHGGQAFFGMNTLVHFDWRISTNGVDLSEAEFRELVEQNRRLININGQWIKLDPAFIAQVKKLMDKADQHGLQMRDLLQQEFLRSEEASETEEDNPFSEIEIELDDYYEGLLHRLTEIGEVPRFEVSPQLQAQLRPYQQKGLEWLVYLRSLGFGALLADDMGLGKSIQTIAYLLHVREQEASTAPSLIVAPTSVLGNWQKEMERFAPSLRIGLHYGSNRAKGEDFLPSLTDKDVILTSYALVNLDEEELASYRFSSIILDEAQNIKNAQTKQSRAVRHLQAQHKIALTGTPMENRLTELWAIFDFLNQGYLGSLPQFQRRFVTPIEKDNDKAKIQQVQRLIAPFLLRRTKQDEEVALNLPDKQEQKEYCPLTVEQASLYEQLVQDTLAHIQTLSGIERRGFILLMLNKLKQICNHPALYLKEEQPTELTERSNKMLKLLELVDNIQDRNESCLIFTQYIRMGNMLKSLIEEATGEPVLFLNGSVPKAERDKMIEQFQNGRYKFFILSLKAGGTGLNLTAANHVIHYDRWWNPAVENQATDRAYRIGQKRFVHVHKLITTGTLEEKIDEMLDRKQSLNDAIITSDNWITELTTEELKELLGV